MRLFTIICMAAAMAAVGGEYTIDLPEENVNGRIVAIELSGENLRNLGGHAAWLRLYDAKGNVIPWARDKAMQKNTATKIKSTPITIDLVRNSEDGSLEISFHAAADAALPDDVYLHFNTDVRNFGQNVQIWGKEAGGEEKPLKIDGSGYIFDSSSNIDARQLEVKFSPEKCREFRVRLSAAKLDRILPARSVSMTKGTENESRTDKMTLVEQPFSIKSLELRSRQLDETGVSELTQRLSVPFETLESGHGKSVYLVKPGVAPVNGIFFKFQEENFSRMTTVRNMLGNSEGRIVGRGQVSHVNIGKTQTETAVSISEVNDGTLEVTFEDNDNPPLHLEDVQVSLPIFRLKFVASPEQFPVRLTAVPNSAEPVYDVASILALGGSQQNILFIYPGNFSGQFAGEPIVAEKKSNGVPQSVLYIAVGLAIVAMGGALAAVAKKGSEGNAE